MKLSVIAITTAAIITLLTGCQTAETIAAGISQKSITGSGSVTHNRVGIDPETKTPELDSFIVLGDYTSVRKGEVIIRIETSEDASIFNSSAISKHKKIVITNPTPELLQQLKQ